MSSVIYQPEKPHRCSLPGNDFAGPWEPVGTIRKCECGTYWVVKRFSILRTWERIDPFFNPFLYRKAKRMDQENE